MSLDHKAFVFDHGRFAVDLSSILFRSLETRSSDELRRYINADLGSFRDPYEGEPLKPDWETRLEFGNEHEVGDFALTKFYSPGSNLGLGTEWLDVDTELQSIGRGLNATLLGKTFGPSGNVFDPGRTGSYFQSEDEVVKNLVHLGRMPRAPAVEKAEAILRNAEAARRGLYLTF